MDCDNDKSSVTGGLDESGEQIHRSSTLRWATFDDLLDDALEEGKLSSTSYVFGGRRLSVPTSSNFFSSSISSNSSFGSTGDGPHPQFQASYISDFSQSFGGTHSKPHRNSVNNKEPKPDPEPVLRTCSTLPSLFVATVSETSSTQTLSQGKCGENLEMPPKIEDQRTDKYMVFRRLSGARYKGWSSKVLTGTAATGWSEELLDASGSGGASSSTEDESWMDCEKDEVFYSRPNTLQVSVEEEPWYQALSTGTWDKSPSRTFLRNFP